MPDLLSNSVSPAPAAVTAPLSRRPSVPVAAWQVLYQDMADTSYREGVASLFKARSPLTVSCTQPQNAATVLGLFFEKAVERVRIFSWRLDPAIFGDPVLCARAALALSRGVRITVLVQDAALPSAFLDLALGGGAGNNVELFSCAGTDAADWDVNFAVMDSRAYRWQNDREKAQAGAIFHDPERGSRWTEAFDRVWRQQTTGADTPDHR